MTIKTVERDPESQDLRPARLTPEELAAQTAGTPEWAKRVALEEQAKVIRRAHGAVESIEQGLHRQPRSRSA